MDLQPIGNTALHQQAELLDSQFMVLGRYLFGMEDDPVVQLPLGQLRVCGMLYQQGPRSLSALGKELAVSLSAMTQIADRLERARLVKRIADEADRRVKSLQLTVRGQEIMRCREESRIRRMFAMLARLSPEAREEAAGVFQALADICGEVEREHVETHAAGPRSA